MPELNNKETIQDRRQRLSSIPKACEGCRIRKVRCDRSNPCANCRTAGIVCQQTGAKTESRVKPDKVSRLESMIERLDSRLGRIEDQLKDSSRQPTPEKLTVNSSSTLLYEGASSFTNASAEATEVAKLTAFSQASGGGENLTASFDDLKTLLQPATTLEDFQFSKANSLRIIPAMTLVSSALVADIVRSFKVRTPFFLMSYPMNDLSMVEDLFRKVYFPTEPLTIGHVTAMHGILLSLLKEFIGLKDPLAEKYDLSTYLPACEKNFNLGMETYEILVVPSFENVLSVLLAVIKAQDEANVLLSSTFVSVAARHCLLLGYHRTATYQNLSRQTASNISRLFWMVYVVDKNMSLLLGRASCIQDYDVDVFIPPHSENPAIRPWDEVFVKNVTLGKLQGQIYDRIYSATALKSNPEVRIQHIQCLAEELHEWRRAVHQIDFSRIKTPFILDLCRPTWDIMYYSILTSLLRGASTSTTAPEITSQCFQAARSALQNHMRLFPVYVESTHMSASDYANWLILYSSFTPFIVTFLHAIASSSLEDTLLLEDVVRTLQPIKSTSKACARLYQICTIFARVARGLVESRNSFLGAYNAQNDSFLLLNDTSQSSLFDPGFLQDYFSAEVDMLDQFTYSEAEDVSAVLGNWASGQPPMVDFLGMGV
ncbi:Zn(II)2Cys6 transcription factor [Aspergillus undulatus]|uniref:Zn(II)2Cys6 transcription factor n=1 Tax=Aspergillus undulatus TaxID=1810928 RepID=UPI003CCD8BEC